MSPLAAGSVATRIGSGSMADAAHGMADLRSSLTSERLVVVLLIGAPFDLADQAFVSDRRPADSWIHYGVHRSAAGRRTIATSLNANATSLNANATSPAGWSSSRYSKPPAASVRSTSS